MRQTILLAVFGFATFLVLLRVGQNLLTGYPLNWTWVDHAAHRITSGKLRLGGGRDLRYQSWSEVNTTPLKETRDARRVGARAPRKKDPSS